MVRQFLVDYWITTHKQMKALARKYDLSPFVGLYFERMALLRACCEEAQVTPAAVASRRDLERLVLGDREVPLLHGWRAAIADDELAGCALVEARLTHHDPLAGEVSAAVNSLCRSLIRGDAWDMALRRVIHSVSQATL